MKHPRAELIAKWLEDTTQTIWRWNGQYDGWVASEHTEIISWNFASKFDIGEKPTEPPQKMCELAGAKFPAPFSITESTGALLPVGYPTLLLGGVFWFRAEGDRLAFEKAIAEAAKQAIKEAK